MSRKRCPEEFKVEAVKQVTEAGYCAYDVAERLGTTTNSLYSWIRRYGCDASDYQRVSQESDEIRGLKKELRWVTEGRDLFKKAAAYFASHPEGDTPLSKIIRVTLGLSRCADFLIFIRVVITPSCFHPSLLGSVRMTRCQD